MKDIRRRFASLGTLKVEFLLVARIHTISSEHLCFPCTNPSFEENILDIKDWTIHLTRTTMKDISPPVEKFVALCAPEEYAAPLDSKKGRRERHKKFDVPYLFSSRKRRSSKKNSDSVLENVDREKRDETPETAASAIPSNSTCVEHTNDNSLPLNMSVSVVSSAESFVRSVNTDWASFSVCAENPPEKCSMVFHSKKERGKHHLKKRSIAILENAVSEKNETGETSEVRGALSPSNSVSVEHTADNFLLLNKSVPIEPSTNYIEHPMNPELLNDFSHDPEKLVPKECFMVPDPRKERRERHKKFDICHLFPTRKRHSSKTSLKHTREKSKTAGDTLESRAGTFPYSSGVEYTNDNIHLNPHVSVESPIEECSVANIEAILTSNIDIPSSKELAAPFHLNENGERCNQNICDYHLSLCSGAHKSGGSTVKIKESVENDKEYVKTPFAVSTETTFVAKHTILNSTHLSFTCSVNPSTDPSVSYTKDILPHNETLVAEECTLIPDSKKERRERHRKFYVPYLFTSRKKIQISNLPQKKIRTSMQVKEEVEHTRLVSVPNVQISLAEMSAKENITALNAEKGKRGQKRKCGRSQMSTKKSHCLDTVSHMNNKQNSIKKRNETKYAERVSEPSTSGLPTKVRRDRSPDSTSSSVSSTCTSAPQVKICWPRKQFASKVAELKIQKNKYCFICPEVGCNGTFRKVNLLVMHVKRYHHNHSQNIIPRIKVMQ